jgi:hypothetical protein
MSKLASALQISPQDIFSYTSTQQADLGAIAKTADGRTFRYVKAGGTALVVGKLQQNAAETTAWENLTAVAASVGDTTIASTSTVTLTANQLAGGFAIITVTPGVGYIYQISGHAAYSAAAPTLALTDPIQVALTTSSRIDLVPSPYSAVIVNPATATGAPVGVAVAPITASYFGWVQSGGIAAVLADGAITVGTNVIASNAVAGAVEPGADTADLQATVGTAFTGIADTEYGAVNLLLA